MNILFNSTMIAVGFGFIVVNLSFRKIRSHALNDKMKLASRQLAVPLLPLILALITMAFAYYYKEAWVSGLAAVLGLSGVASYFKRFRLFMREYKFESEQADMKVLGIWIAWLLLLVLTIIHIIYLVWT